MEINFRISGRIARPVEEVFEAVADPDKLSNYFTTGGAVGRLETGATVSWDFHDFPGAFPVFVTEVADDEKIVFEWQANEPGADYRVEVTMRFTEVGPGRTKVEVEERGWRSTDAAVKASYGNCMGWAQMLAALKAWAEHGINLRDGAYR